MSMFLPSVEKRDRNDLHVSVDIYMMLLTVRHFLLNKGPIVTFISNFPLQGTNQFRVSASTNMFFILVNILFRSAILFIMSSYLGLSNSSAYNT